MKSFMKIFTQKEQQEIFLSGDYESWNEAVTASMGYDSDLILEKTKDALLKVKNGEAIYERDSVIFNEVQYAWPLLAGLMWVAAKSDGRLNVLDFGGSLGSTYFQNLAFFHELSEIHWNIIEQSEHVKVGKEYFEDDILKFYPNIEICLSETKPNIILLSGVLQYLESPYGMFDTLLDHLTCDTVIIDRTSFWDGSTDMLCIQHVPPSIYSATYPIWIFSRQKFLQYLQKRNFEIVAEFQSLDMLKAPVRAVWKGMVLERKKSS